MKNETVWNTAVNILNGHNSILPITNTINLNSLPDNSLEYSDNYSALVVTKYDFAGEGTRVERYVGKLTYDKQLASKQSIYGRSGKYLRILGEEMPLVLGLDIPKHRIILRHTLE